MSEDHDPEQPAVLPKADGPLVAVTLPDGQRLYAVAKARVREPDASWWYDLQIHLPSQGSERGRLLALPAAVDFRAPADLCAPVDGQSYDQVPTVRPGVTPVWKVEERSRRWPHRTRRRTLVRQRDGPFFHFPWSWGNISEFQASGIGGAESCSEPPITACYWCQV
jgi:hypothetical protein